MMTRQEFDKGWHKNETNYWPSATDITRWHGGFPTEYNGDYRVEHQPQISAIRQRACRRVFYKDKFIFACAMGPSRTRKAVYEHYKKETKKNAS